MEASEPPAAADPMTTGAEQHLLPGDEPDSRYVDDALQWISVYQELIAVRNDLLEVLHQGVADGRQRLLSLQPNSNP